jgi:hypothetical protein
MKNLILLSILLLSTIVAHSQPKQPKVYFGDFGQINANGVPRAIVTTQAKVLAKPKIYAERGCQILNYNVSILPKGGGIKGPMPGTTQVLPKRITDRIVELGTNAILYFENIHVLYNDEPIEIAPFTIKYEE